jgi:hypothetical protein
MEQIGTRGRDDFRKSACAMGVEMNRLIKARVVRKE